MTRHLHESRELSCRLEKRLFPVFLFWRKYSFNVYDFAEREIHAFEAKLGDRCFCWFPAVMLVPIRMGTSMASLYKSLYILVKHFGRSRGRHACLPLVPSLSCAHYFQAPATQAKHFSGYLVYERLLRLDLGEGLNIFTSFRFPDSGLYLLNGFAFYFDGF